MIRKNIVTAALRERLAIRAMEYPLPAHAQSLPYMLGGLTFTTFMVLFGSAIYLTQFYDPNQLSSYQSVQYLVTHVPFGNFIRSIHYWAADILFMLISAHLVRVFITGSYKRPREFTWLAGLGLLLIAILFTFAGTILPLGQEGIEAEEHFNEIGVILGPLGSWFTSGFSASIPLVGRVYIAHVIILPLLFVLFVATHFYFIHVHNVSPKATESAIIGHAHDGETAPFTSHLKKLVGWSCLLIALLAFLALLFPEPLGHAGVAGPPMIEVKPRWMFLWLYGMEDVFGMKTLVYAPIALFVLLAVVPFIDRSPRLNWRGRLGVMAYGAFIVLALVGFSLQAIFAPTNMAAMGKDALRTFERMFIVETAYAHDLVFLSFEPTTIVPGGTVTVSGDGLHESGAYSVSLIGIKKSVLLGSATIKAGSDSFTLHAMVPARTPAGLYVVVAQDLGTHDTFYAPLSLSVPAASMPTSRQYPDDARYPIPRGELPWIIGFIAGCVGIGSALLVIKDRHAPRTH